MTTVATLLTNRVQVMPGTEAVCQLEIRNEGQIVESYQLDVVGPGSGWAIVQPSNVSLVPGDTAVVSIVFHPPRTPGVQVGEIPFGVRVAPSHHPELGVVPEGVVEVVPFTDTVAELRPQTSVGRKRARHELAVDNRGNVPTQVEVQASDPDDLMVITALPAVFDVGSDQARFATINVKHRKRLWRGQPETRRFRVVVQTPDGPPIALDGATVQQPVLSRGAIRALAALVLLALGAVALWLGPIKGAISSAAQEAVKEQTGGAQRNTSAAAGTNGTAATTGTPESPSPSPTPTAGPPVTPAPPVKVTTPLRFRLEVSGPVNANTTRSSSQLRAPTGNTLVLTDFFVQNPQGDEGRLDIVVNGSPIYVYQLKNFRNDEFHLLSPIEITGDQSIFIRITCVTAGPQLPNTSGTNCREGLLVTGFQRPNA
ncbi:MAG TPA: hypothetical protein VFC19_25190 [Candidatus Limnocylindrales bacterium]|nr:hypothetical protein [Candidatus Limnocylindrales bacterium]